MELTRFVGRERELAMVRRLLGRARLVTLVGAGGCGKTRLALRVAGRMLVEWTDGVWWVDLACLVRGQAVVAAVAGALGVREQPGRSTLEALCARLGDRRALVVLDNCEHVLDECAELAERLLGAGGQLRVLATSREPVGIGGETVWRVPPLSTPPEAVGASPEWLVRFDSVRLFLDRAAAAEPSFQLDEGNVDVVAQVCARLDGIPLAIELAAAQTAALDPSQIASALDDCFALLTRGSRSALPRQKTLRASMDWSHGLLDDDERTVFRRLAVFVGSFCLESAQVVCADERLDAGCVLDGLTRLVHKSLVAVEEYALGRRYRLLETVQQYAAERLSEAGETIGVRNRHLEAALALAERVGPELETGSSGERIGLLDLERGNLRAALDWSIDQRIGDAPLRLAGGLALFFGVRAHFDEGGRYVEDALAAGALEPSPERARALCGAGYLGFVAQQRPRAQEYASLALEMARSVGDRQTAARALVILGGVGVAGDAPARARDHLAEGLTLARVVGDDWCQAQALGFISMSWINQGALEPARRSLSAASQVVERLGDRRFLAWHLAQSAAVELRSGDLAAAVDASERANMWAAELGDRACLAWNAMNRAEIDSWRGRAHEARDAIAVLAVELGRSVQGTILALLLHAAIGRCDLALGELDEAERELRLVAEMAREHRTLAEEAACLIDLAESALLRGRADEARTLAEEALQRAAHLANGWLVAGAKVRLGRSALANGDLERGRELCDEALELQRDGGYRLDAVTTLDTLAGLDVQREQHVRAARLIGAAIAARRRLGARRRPLDELRDTESRGRVIEALDRATLTRALRDGRTLSLDDAIAYALRGRGARKRPATGWDSLTPAERAVARLVADGRTNAEIAQQLFVATATVKTHVNHIFNKLGITHRAELSAEVARRLG